MGKGKHQGIIKTKTFRKRLGTTDRGQEYEDLVSAKLILQLAIDETVTNFKLSSNDNDYGKFDDIVLEVESRGTTKLYAFQLKHKNRKKALSLNSLQAVNGNFSILKYYESHQNIKKLGTFIIYTNRPLRIDNNKDGTIYIDGTEVEIVTKSKVPSFLESKNCKNNCYEFTTKISKNSDNKQIFFKNFMLCTDQPDVEETQENLTKIFQEKFSCDESYAEKFINFVSEWSLQQGEKIMLSKKYILNEIALILLTPYIKELSFVKVDNENKEIRILQNCILKFDITTLDLEHYDCVKKIGGDFNNKFRKIKAIHIKRLNHIYQINYLKKMIEDYSNMDVSKYLWLMKKCPLIVDASKEPEVIYKAIALCPELKFILLQSNVNKEDFPGVKVFQNLSDLDEKSHLYQELIKTFKCSLQGKEEVNVKFLIEENEEFRTMISTNELMKMLRGSFRIGEDKSPVQQPYISRSLSQNFIDIKYIDKINKNVLVVLDCMNKLDLIKTKLGNFNLMRVDVFLEEKDMKDKTEELNTCLANSGHRKLYHTSPILKKFVPGPDLYVSDDHCSLIEFERVREKVSARKRVNNEEQTDAESENCHYLRIIDAKTLEWIRSRGDISVLKDFRKNGSTVEETTLYSWQPDNNINLIDGEPGMGKSELLKNIKNNSSTKVWGIFLDPKDITLLCRNLEEKERDIREAEFMNFILNTKYKGFHNFDKMVVKMFIEKKKVAYFWDALDELHTKDFELITDFIKGISEKSCYQWITSRCHLTKELEQKFKVLSRNICQFDGDQQNKYIHERLKDVHHYEEIDDVIKKINSTVSLVKYNDVLGLPLQIFMITELFRQNFEKFYKLLDERFSLVDLYQHIIDKKFNTYYTEKANVHCPNQELCEVLDSYKNLMFEKYKKAGLKGLIQKEFFSKLNISCGELSDEFKNSADKIGLITEINNDFPKFLHNSYAEFFAALYFKEHHEKIEDFEINIYKRKYTNIRFFFDLLTGKNELSHIAVLYKNINMLKAHSTDLKNCKDSRGRNVLELASSWGDYYPVLGTEKIEEGYIIDNENDNSSTGENSDYMEMLNYILDNVSEDNQKSSLATAAKANCLMAKISILLKQKKKLATLGETNETLSILYYSIKFDYPEVINLFEKLPFLKTKTDHGSMLHLAITYEKEECLRKLLETKVYAKAINDKNNYGYTPLIQACQSGYYNLVEVLLKSGADPNCEGCQGTTALHTACLHAHEKIVKLLLKFDADVNKTKDYGITPLHATCWNGHESVVAILLKHNANINARTEDGCTSLYVASRNKHKKVVKILLENGADINLSQNHQVTPLLIACQEGHIENVELLLEAGAAVNHATISGETPLFMASQNGHEKTVEKLLESGAAVDAVTNDRWTSLQIATQQGHYKVADLLIKAGANVYAEVGSNVITKID